MPTTTDSLAAAIQAAEGDASRLLAAAALAALRAVDAIDPDEPLFAGSPALAARNLAVALAEAALAAAEPLLHPAHADLAEAVEALANGDDDEAAIALEAATGWVAA
jgi:hypothetical protein